MLLTEFVEEELDREARDAPLSVIVQGIESEHMHNLMGNRPLVEDAIATNVSRPAELGADYSSLTSPQEAPSLKECRRPYLNIVAVPHKCHAPIKCSLHGVIAAIESPLCVTMHSVQQIARWWLL